MNEQWLQELQAEVDRTSGAAAGRRIGISGSTISQVLRGTYPGRLDRVKAKVEGALMGLTVDCPVIGELPRHRCIEYQGRKFAATNPMRVQLYHACRGGCPHSRIERDKEED